MDMAHTCPGYHFGPAGDSTIMSDDIPHTTNLLRDGWQLVRSLLFDRRGKEVWICPTCYRRWVSEGRKHEFELVREA